MSLQKTKRIRGVSKYVCVPVTEFFSVIRKKNVGMSNTATRGNFWYIDLKVMWLRVNRH